ncbi:hypothetical protein [Ichthyobacterium seriolicida]|uniref:hypothetical protein n=1 Tax=Ichthyobacterium seriolicida TaxID=242600 RepID=UPI000BBCD1E5|nr:hypothetical protein [Ichthyobacterium seriolicida]
MKKQIFIGSLLGFIFPALFFYMYFISTGKDFDIFIDTIVKTNIYYKLISLLTLPNLIIFIILSKMQKDYYLRGILISTMLIALVVLFSQLLK